MLHRSRDYRAGGDVVSVYHDAILGLGLSYEQMAEVSPDLGRYIGGMADRWVWDVVAVLNLSEAEAESVYRKLKDVS